MAGPAPDCLEVDYAAPVESITIRHYQTGLIHKLVLFPSRRRANTFRVMVNGREWTQSMGHDRILRGTVKALARQASIP